MKITFEIGDRIEMTHIKSAMGLKLSEKKYGSQVLDYDGGQMVKVAMPIYENRVVPLETGDNYNLCFFTNSGLYQCVGQIRKRYVENKMYVMDVLFLTELKRYQRRKFYRLDCMFPIKYRLISDVEQTLRERLYSGQVQTSEEQSRWKQMLDEIPKEWEEGTISDLSGGGMRFHGKQELEKDSLIEVKIPLSLQSGIVPLSFLMRVIACVHYEGSRIAYEIRGEFQNVKDAERESVIKYVFEEQRRRMRKK